MAQIFVKDPDDELDYKFDWSNWLATGETISSYTITTETGLTKDSDSESSGVVTVWLSGGTAGNDYDVACKITSSAGRVKERTMTFRVKNQ